MANESQRGLLDPNVEQESIRELSQRRANLMLELKNYEENRRIAAASAGGGGGGGAGGGMGLAAAIMSKAGLGSSISSSMSSADVASQLEVGVIPAQTQLSTALAINLGTDGKPVREDICLFSMRGQQSNLLFLRSRMWR